MSRRGWITSLFLFGALVGIVGGLAAWKYTSILEANKTSASQPEPMESVMSAIAKETEHHPTMTSIGTVLALRSITLRNELAGTVQKVALTPGQVVEAGTLLVALDVSVEEAELEALKAQAVLSETTFSRMQNLAKNLAASEQDLDRARAERDIALAQIARIEATIAKKRIHAPFPARVGISDVHPGQYLDAGTLLTTLQGVDEAVHVDFSVPQRVAEGLQKSGSVEVFTQEESSPIEAEIVAVDARIDPTTRNAMVRAKIKGKTNLPAPGSSIRVRVPTGTSLTTVSIPVSALRKGPEGDHVFVIEADENGRKRAYMRQVQSSDMLGDEVLILTGLSPGEQVAASGSFKLNEGMLVTIINEPETDSRTKR